MGLYNCFQSSDSDRNDHSYYDKSDCCMYDNIFSNEKTDHPIHLALASGTLWKIKALLDDNSMDIEALDRDGNTPLIVALSNGLTLVTELLLKRDVNVNAKNYNGETPLHFAILKGNEQYISQLIEKGAQINSMDKNNKTPLINAVESNSKSAVELLLTKNCNINLQDKNGNSSLHIALENNYQEISEILINGESNLLLQNRNGDTALHIAAYKCDSTVKILLDSGASTNVQNNLGETALMVAVKNALLSVSELLVARAVEENDKVKSVNLKNIKGKTALQLVAGFMSISEMKGIKLCELLITNGADINVQDNKGQTALHIAIRSRNEEICKFLLAKGTLVNITDKDGDSPLHTAVRENCNKIIEMILANGSNVLQQNRNGDTALHIAAYTSELTVKILLDRGACTSIRNNFGETPLMVAVHEKIFSICELLVDKDTDKDVRAKSVNIKNNSGKTALHMTVGSLNSSVVPDVKFCEFLFANGADVNIMDNTGKTALHAAVLYDCKDICKFLLAKGALVNIKDKAGKTPLHYAITVDTQLMETILDFKDKVKNCINLSEKAWLQLLTDLNKHLEELCSLLSYEGENLSIHVIAESGNSERMSIYLKTLLGVKYKIKDVVYKLFLAIGGDVFAQCNDDRLLLHTVDSSVHEKTFKIFLDEGITVKKKNIYGRMAFCIAVGLDFFKIV